MVSSASVFSRMRDCNYSKTCTTSTIEVPVLIPLKDGSLTEQVLYLQKFPGIVVHISIPCQHDVGAMFICSIQRELRLQAQRCRAALHL